MVSLEFLSVIFAIHKCDNVNLFGLYDQNPTTPAQGDSNVSYSKEGRKTTSDYEFKIVEQLEMKNVVKLNRAASTFT